jgi:hypothetical protein
MTTTSSPTTKIKYINNRELLTEIHNSKKSFCVFLEPEHANFDTIVHNVSEITPELIEAVREKKAKPRGKPAIPLDQLPPEGIVVRVMTYEHIPLDPDRVRKSRVTDQSYARTSFPPFKHYVLIDGAAKEVCRSHWVGGFDNGHFVADNGRINHRLALMFMLLVERYSRRGNWRGYTYNDEMRSQALLQLSQIGLQFDESKSDNPFAFYTTAIRNCFTRVLNLEKKAQNIRDDMLIIAGASPSYTRQIDNEMEYRFPSEHKATAPRKAGAPKKTAKPIPDDQ